MGGTWVNALSARSNGKTVIFALFAAIITILPPLYYGLSLFEKSVPILGHFYRSSKTVDQGMPDDEWLREPQLPLDIDRLTDSPWVGRQWYETDGDAELYLDPAAINTEKRIIPVQIDKLPDGPLEIQLRSEGKRSYRGPAFCGHHGGEVSDDNAVIIRLRNNLLRVVVTFNRPPLKNIDKIFSLTKSK